MKKRYLVPFILLLLIAGAGFFAFRYLTGDSASKMRALYLVPKDAIYIIETEEPLENWKNISQSEPWKFLKTNDYFGELTSGADYLDSLIADNASIFGEFGSRQVIVSAHMITKKDYDFLYIVDLQNISKLSGVTSGFLKKIEGFKTTERDYKGYKLFELYDTEAKETLYLSFVENLLLCSYHHSLVEKAINEKDDPQLGRNQHFIEVEKEVRGEDMFRVYMQYAYLDDYMANYLEEENEYVNALSTDLTFSGLSFSYDEDETLLSFDGITKLDLEKSSYLKLLVDGGSTKFSFDEVVSKRAATVVSLGIDDFPAFYNWFLEKSKTEESGAEYQENIEKIEKFLNISLKENFVSWIGEEVCFVQTQPLGLGKENEYALFIKATDIGDAKENLNYIGSQIKKRTPVKFKGVDYNGHQIKFLSVKGLFKLMLGDLFGSIEKPYYSIVGDYVVFSNHPQTIKNVIDDYKNDQVLAKDDGFKTFRKSLNNKSSVLLYVNTPIAYSSLQGYTDSETKSDVKDNKKYFAGFPHIAFQLTEKNKDFRTKIVVDYLGEEQVKEIQKDLIADSKQKRQHLNKNSIEATDTSNKKVSLKEVEATALIEISDIILDDLDAKSQEGKYESGEVKYEVGIKNGMKHGDYREYSKNGQLIIKGKYKNDKKVGLWRFYNEEGNQIKKERF